MILPLVFSRGDFKISDQVFRKEVCYTRFKVIEVKAFGIIQDIGALVIYAIKK